MGNDQDWQRILEEERYRETCEAIDRCAKAGADIDAIKVICRETGVDIRHTILGDEIRIARVAR